MSNASYPLHYNIYDIPPETDSFPPFPASVGDGIKSAFLDDRNGYTLGHTQYCRGFVGSEALQVVYDRISRAVSDVAMRSAAEPLAIVGGNDIALGRAIYTGRGMSSFRMLAESALSYSLLLNLADDAQAPSYYSLVDGVLEKHNSQPSRAIAVIVEKAKWKTEDGLLRVQRDDIQSLIAVGREAIEQLPQLANLELANAYDQLVN